jgi:hypothetical protein
MSGISLYLWVWLGVGVLLLVVERQSPLRQWLRDRHDPGRRDLLEALDPRLKTRGYRLRTRVLAPLYATVMMVPLWPLMPLSRLIDWLDHRALLRQREEAVFKLRPEYRRERLNVAEVERRETVQDPLGAVPELPFGHLNVAWQALKASMEPADELWSFSARWDDDWGEPHLREGYAVWRRGKPAGFVLSLYQPLEDLGVVVLHAQPARGTR